jgi:SAM-dependent methyltransferase
MPQDFRRKLTWRFPRLVGPFGFQPNNTTRRFEYPWAWQVRPVQATETVVEIGGGLGGLQFVLSRAGASVINVDPGEAAEGRGWPVTPEAIAHLNRAFRTSVRLIPTTLQAASLPDESVDAIYSISTIEHIPKSEMPSMCAEIFRILKPGGRIVLTIDLFLDVEPFGSRPENQFGTNIDVWNLIAMTGFDIEVGDPASICGSPEFEPARILDRLPDLTLGGYPALVQAVVLRKPDQS